MMDSLQMMQGVHFLWGTKMLIIEKYAIYRKKGACML